MAFIGVDLHTNSFTACRLDANGREAFSTFHLAPADIDRFCAGLDADDEIAVEATGNSAWFRDQVISCVGRVVVVNPKQFQVIRKSVNKTDKNDARALAFFLSKDMLPETRVKLQTEGELASLTHTRDLLVKQRTRLINKIHAVFNRHGIKVRKESLGSKRALEKLEIGRFSTLEKVELTIVRDQALSLTAALAKLDGEIEKAARKLAGYDGLTSIKGIGPRSAAVFLTAIGDVNDFEAPDKLAAYLGIVPKVSQSNETDNRGRITKRGNRLARTTLVQCTLIAIRYSGYLNAFYRRIKARRGAGKASQNFSNGSPASDRYVPRRHRERLDQQAAGHITVRDTKARQSEVRGQSGFILRSGDQPELRHDASHYGVGVLPARPKRPKDKAKVENGVRFAQTCILGRLRRQTFFSLAEANAAIVEAADRINDHVMRRLGVSRRHLFQTVEGPALAGLPSEDYEFAEWRFARVGADYHVEFDSFFYSVPHGLIRQQVDCRATARAIEIFHRGKRVAVHERRYGGRRHGANPDHMPNSHRRYVDWTPERFRRWAASIGPETEGLITAILANRPHPEQGFRTCLGVLRLYRGIEKARAEAVSARALQIGGLTYKSIASILANRLAAKPTTDTKPAALVDHANLRGPDYFH